jgi:dsDNA-specific endonuclease/ATPase MutS2
MRIGSPAGAGRIAEDGAGAAMLLFVPMDETEPPDPAADPPIDLPIDGTLDLHAFDPREVKLLIPDYLAACRARGILSVRIVHGKGTGALRQTVHSLLGRLPEVASFRTASEDAGGWGATLVELRP